MRLSSRFVVTLALLTVVRFATAANSPPTPSNQPIAVEDLVRFATVGDPLSVDWNESNGDPGIVSPDRSKVAIVVRRGDPQNGTNVATLLIFSTAELLNQPEPLRAVEFESESNHQPIALVRWLDDSETIFFAGTRGQELSQVYRFNLRSRKWEQVSHVTEELFSYDVTPSGAHLITVTDVPTHPIAQDPVCRRGCRVTSDNFFEVERGAPYVSVLSVHDLRTGQVKVVPSPPNVLTGLGRCYEALVGEISPDGRFGIQGCLVATAREWPVWWGEYQVAASRLVRCSSQRNVGCAWRLILTDFETGQSLPIDDTPFIPDMQPAPIWIDGGRRLLFPGALESLAEVTGAERAERATSFSIVSYDPLTRRSKRLARLGGKVAQITDAKWDQNAQILAIAAIDAAKATLPAVQYERRGSRWVTVTQPARQEGVSAQIVQSLNDPPVLVAAGAANEAKRPLLDPNPFLSNRQLGAVEAVEWKCPDGRVWTGGLYYPQNFRPGVRYPVVIQTHGFSPDQFSLTGLARTFAGRALAAHDILVLQVREVYRDVSNTPAEWTVVQSGYEAAIDYLDARGMIDRSRVGIQGWSRTGPQMGYTLTHSSYPFAAGAFTDTGDVGWMFYLLHGAYSQQNESWYGSAPFGPGIESWLEYSPTFNLDRLRTPMFIWAGGGAGAGIWSWYAGSRRLGRPVEYWVNSDGVHEVFKVDQRLLSNQLLVDWFRFWLKDEEDSDPSKSDQYTRWRILREQQREVLKQPRPPLLNWSATPFPAQH